MTIAVNHMRLPHVSWFVVANREEAVIFRGDRNGPKEFLQRFKNNPSDKRSNGRNNLRLVRAPEPAQFARAISRAIESGWKRRRFDDVVVVAEPHFLGLLQKNMPATIPPSAQSHLAKEISRLSSAAVAEGVQQALRTKRQA